ncbi:GntR family transcriptional regulator [Sphingomonas sp. PsM26]|nr:GntR family transcriptional regulator [Sphingomonas sp. PsM26]
MSLYDKDKKYRRLPVAEEIGVAIVTGVYPPHSRLPNEQELAAQRGISRGVVREGLKVLAAKGLLSSSPRSGTKVNVRTKWNLVDIDLLSWMKAVEPTSEFRSNLAQLRLIAEPAAAGLAAVNRTSHQLSEIGSALRNIHGDGLGSIKRKVGIRHFRRMVWQATSNELLIKVGEYIEFARMWGASTQGILIEDFDSEVLLYDELFNAFATEDGRAARETTIKIIRKEIRS